MDEIIAALKMHRDNAETDEDRALIDAKILQVKAANRATEKLIGRLSNSLSAAFLGRIFDDQEAFYDNLYELIINFLSATCSAFHCGPAVDEDSKEQIACTVKATQSIIDVISHYEDALCEEHETARSILARIKRFKSEYKEPDKSTLH